MASIAAAEKRPIIGHSIYQLAVLKAAARLSYDNHITYDRLWDESVVHSVNSKGQLPAATEGSSML